MDPLKLFLTATAVQVNPELAADVILHAGVFLIVKSIQSPTDNCVHLCTGHIWSKEL